MRQSRKDVARRLGVSGSTITQWETGHEPKPQYWPKIIRYLGRDPVCQEPKTVPEKIGYVCRARGLSRQALAELLGTNKMSIVNWERGKTAPRPGSPSIARLEAIFRKTRRRSR